MQKDLVDLQAQYQTIKHEVLVAFKDMLLLYLLGKKPEQMKIQAHVHLRPHIHDTAHLDLRKVRTS